MHLWLVSDGPERWACTLDWRTKSDSWDLGDGRSSRISRNRVPSKSSREEATLWNGRRILPHLHLPWSLYLRSNKSTIVMVVSKARLFASLYVFLSDMWGLSWLVTLVGNGPSKCLKGVFFGSILCWNHKRLFEFSNSYRFSNLLVWWQALIHPFEALEKDLTLAMVKKIQLLSE